MATTTRGECPSQRTASAASKRSERASSRRTSTSGLAPLASWLRCTSRTRRGEFIQHADMAPFDDRRARRATDTAAVWVAAWTKREPLAQVSGRPSERGATRAPPPPPPVRPGADAHRVAASMFGSTSVVSDWIPRSAQCAGRGARCGFGRCRPLPSAESVESHCSNMPCKNSRKSFFARSLFMADRPCLAQFFCRVNSFFLLHLIAVNSQRGFLTLTAASEFPGKVSTSRSSLILIHFSGTGRTFSFI